MATWLDNLGSWYKSNSAGRIAGDVAIGFATTGVGNVIVEDYRANERKKREALRTGNKEAYNALVKKGEEIGSQLDAQDLADIQAEEKALAEWDTFVKLGEQGDLDMQAFRADPTAYIKKRTNFDGVQTEMVKGMDKSAAARGDLLGGEQQARIARSTAELITLKQQEALDNIYSLLNLGQTAKNARTGITSEFDRARHAREAQRVGLTESMGAAESTFHQANRAIQANRSADANALTMNLVNNAANLGMGAATIATGMPIAAAKPLVTQSLPQPATQPTTVPVSGGGGAPSYVNNQNQMWT